MASNLGPRGCEGEGVAKSVPGPVSSERMLAQGFVGRNQVRESPSRLICERLQEAANRNKLLRTNNARGIAGVVSLAEREEGRVCFR